MGEFGGAVEEAGEASSFGGAGDAVDDFALLHEDEGWEGLDAVVDGDFGVGIDVDGDDVDVGEVIGEFFDDGGRGAGGAAPLGAEPEEEGRGALKNVLFEIDVGGGYDDVAHRESGG